MDESQKQEYEETCQLLRAELKRFEADWSSQNGGTKPRREDIKQNPEIARKYKQYNQVRDILSGKVPPPKAKETTLSVRKRKLDGSIGQRPAKQVKPVETPSRVRQRDVDPELFETPSTRKLFSPAVPTSIGPTPQRDGRILGLFDLLEENDENTPSKSRHADGLKDVDIQVTPSKKTGEAGRRRVAQSSRTPKSASKRATPDTFMTPSRRRNGNTSARTPSSVSKLHLSTPSFLRRAPLATVDENGEYLSPAPLRLPRKPLGRSLSSVVASLRKLEEEALDDDLEALREMESEANPSAPAKPAKPKEDILEPDSQQQQRLLGAFDDEGLYDSAPEDQVGRDGQPLRVYKKKGQKRTTRRANMKPVQSKRPQETIAEEESEDDDDDDVVPETQAQAAGADRGEPSPPVDLGSESEFDPAADEEAEEEGKPAAKAGKSKRAAKEAEGQKEKGKEKKEGKIRKAARKVNELAHANFKRLKLKNNGAKGPSAFGGRFRRRR
ncbi:DNA replication/checkpoint protein [Durotheca rogersii]|uniref:DNA replication/checkpoint protein n=1 Tax=Durotheca rogersii TaxID=419775 RepID=UPI00221F6431|nr:DNA replication/checkpoint protein [Durotheca rogersii]KAI5863732.1 DNA replication/checkpoint protein [Durotheca rogersii]